MLADKIIDNRANDVNIPSFTDILKFLVPISRSSSFISRANVSTPESLLISTKVVSPSINENIKRRPFGKFDAKS